jgi:hypothetical protein
MSITKIKNLKYSQSKNQEEIKWAEQLAKRNRMLAESDWTQLPDVKLSVWSKNRWANWREELRQLRRLNFETAEELKLAIESLEEDKLSLYVDYAITDSIKDPESGRRYLYQMLIKFYKEQHNSMFSPNLEEKYQETLDLLSTILADHNRDDIATMDELIQFVEDLDELEMDTEPFPFVELTMHLKNYTLHQAILYILREKKKQHVFALQEEHNLIHYENRISACLTVEEVLKAKKEIEMHYGY